MLNPFQCVLFLSRFKQGLPSIILAASGSSIYSFSSSDGDLLSIWPRRTLIEMPTKVDSIEMSGTSSEHPGKRRKLSAEASSESSSANIIVENGAKKKRSRGNFMGASIPAVIKLIGTISGHHAVAVTGEDKRIRVFDIRDDGSIEQLSERAMPKRPCSITLTTDEKFILCADKFGDVYALPFENIPIDTRSDSGTGRSVETPALPVEKPFIPAANHLTIHTKTNQRALQNQQNAAQKVTEKKALAFAHQLLLGHVSLLTDLAYVTVPTRNANGLKTRDYILTADRDEHIRISRGLPQSHVIENYCLGHTSFVSKLCVPTWKPDLLISGGGDGYLLLWDWLAGRILQKTEIAAILNARRPSQNSRKLATHNGKNSLGETSPGSISVSGLWAIQSLPGNRDPVHGNLMVACEAVPVLLVFNVTSNNQLDFCDCLEFPGNVLDLCHDPEQGALLVTLDNAHQPWFTDQRREQSDKEFLAICNYSKERGSWTVAKMEFGFSVALNEWASNAHLLKSEELSHRSPLSELLYGIENLRKRSIEE